jgi:hypothetical protein
VMLTPMGSSETLPCAPPDFALCLHARGSAEVQYTLGAGRLLDRPEAQDPGRNSLGLPLLTAFGYAQKNASSPPLRSMTRLRKDGIHGTRRHREWDLGGEADVLSFPEV